MIRRAMVSGIVLLLAAYVVAQEATNAVGFVRMNFPRGQYKFLCTVNFGVVSRGGSHVVSNLLDAAQLPGGTQVYLWDQVSRGYGAPETVVTNGVPSWNPGTNVFPMGCSFWVVIPTNAPLTNYVVTINGAIPADPGVVRETGSGSTFIGFPYHARTRLTDTTLGLNAMPGDLVHRWQSNAWASAQWITVPAPAHWSSDLSIDCFDGFAYQSKAATNRSVTIFDTIPWPEEPVLDTTTPAQCGGYHTTFMQRVQQGNIDLLFMGDSITFNWTKAATASGIGLGLPVWLANYSSATTTNFGISGQEIQGVLWAIQNGEIDTNTPKKLIVLLIGTNNLLRDPAEDIEDGIWLIIRTMREKAPQSKVLLLGILPRWQSPLYPYRAKIKSINRNLAKLDDGQSVRFLDIGDKLLQPDGTISTNTMYDYLHPTTAGYQIIADEMRPLFTEMMAGE